MFLSPADENEVIRVVESCKNKSSTDAEGLSMNIVQHIITSIIKPLTHICNTSFKTGAFPDKLKIAKVIPVFKSGIKEDCSNYRPISLLPQFSKILEKLFNSRLSAFIDKNNIINPSQYGFRENMSTTYALTELINEITSSLRNKVYSIGVFIDLKKAFDTVDHELFCEKKLWYQRCGTKLDKQLLIKQVPICLLQLIPLRPVKYIMGRNYLYCILMIIFFFM